jgi:hypothetical protein
MKKPLDYFVCSRTADCYVLISDDNGRWTYGDRRVALWSANYQPSNGRLEFRWDVSPLNEGFDSYEKARGAISHFSLARA